MSNQMMYPGAKLMTSHLLSNALYLAAMMSILLAEIVQLRVVIGVLKLESSKTLAMLVVYRKFHMMICASYAFEGAPMVALNAMPLNATTN